MADLHPGIDALERLKKAPEWEDLSLEEKQAQLDYVIDRTLFPNRPDLADEIRGSLYASFGADKPKAVPFAGTPGGKAIGNAADFLLTPFEFAKQPLKNIRDTLASPEYPGEIGDAVLDATGSPAAAATAKTLADLPTEVPMLIAEGTMTPLGIAASVVPPLAGVVGGARRALRPPAKPAEPPVAPGMARFGTEQPQVATSPATPPVGMDAKMDPFLAQLEAKGKTVGRDPITGEYGIVDKKKLTESVPRPSVAGQPLSAKPTRTKDYSRTLELRDADGVKKVIILNPNEAERLGRLAAGLSESESSPFKPVRKQFTIPDESRRSGFTKAKATGEIISSSNEVTPSELIFPEAAKTLASKSDKPYYGTDFRKQFQETSSKGYAVADNLADPAEAAGKVVPPNVPAAPSPKYPNAFWRANAAAVDVLARFGDDGVIAASRIHKMYDTSESASMRIMSRWIDEMDGIFGKRSPWSVERINPFASNSTDRLFNMTKAESDNLVDVLYTDRKVRPINERVEKAAAAFTRATKEINEHPGIRSATVRNRFTGEEKPVGEAGTFFPQQPVREDVRAKMAYAYNESAYNRAKNAAKAKGETLTRKDWADRLTRVEQALEGNLDPYFAGVKNARTFHADEYGLPSQILGKAGYETDVMRALFRYVSKTSLFAERQVAKEEMSLLQDKLLTRYASLENNDARNFVNNVFDIAMGQGKVDVVDDALAKFSHFAIELNSATLLQLAGVSSLPQTSYAIAQAGPKAAVQGLARYLGDTWAGNVKNVEKSGALYSHWVQEMTAPQTLLGKWAQGMLRANAFTSVDRVGRVTAGYMGAAGAKNAAAALALYAPGKGNANEKLYRRAAALLQEVHLNPAEVLAANGKLSETQVLTAAQVFANQTMGRTSIQGLPAWTQSSNEYLRMALQFKNFLFANTAQMSRSMRNSPDAATAVKRALTLATGTQISGEAVNDMLYTIRNSRLGEGYLADPFEKQERGAKQLESGLRHSPFKHVMNTKLGARVIENWITGVGTVWAGILISGVPDAEHLIASMAGPTAATIAKVGTDAAKFAAGEFTDPLTSHIAEDAARRLPFVGPTAAQGIREDRKRKSRSPLSLPGTRIPSVFGNQY